jgi:hypothetical protein
MTETENVDLKPVIAAIYVELAALWHLQAQTGLVVPPGAILKRGNMCLALSRLLGPEREITHDELLALYKQWGGQ